MQFPRSAGIDDIVAALAKYPFLLDESEARAAIKLYTKIWGSSSKDAWSIAQHILGDVMFSCPSRHAARQLAALSPTFLYFFAAEPVVPCLGKSIHGCELPFVFDMSKYLFDNVSSVSSGAGTPTVMTRECDTHKTTSSARVGQAWEKSLATKMSTMWAKFAGRGVPEDDWPAVVANEDKGINNFVFQLLESYNATIFKEEVCAFWDSHLTSPSL